MSEAAYCDVVGAATITATYLRDGKKWRVFIRPANARRITRVVATESDAKDLVRHFNRLGMAGVDLCQALAEARAQTARQADPTLPECLPAFLDEPAVRGNLVPTTLAAFQNQLC